MINLFFDLFLTEFDKNIVIGFDRKMISFFRLTFWFLINLQSDLFGTFWLNLIGINWNLPIEFNQSLQLGSIPKLSFLTLIHSIKLSITFRKNIDLLNLNSPLESNNQTYEISESGRHYVNLTLAMKSTMYGNNPIIPFFDSQALISFPVVPFCRLGIFYKSQPSYEGFLTFKQIFSEFRHFISN